MLPVKDRPQPELALLCNGELTIARGRDGTLIGEMTFIRGCDATATVTTCRSTRYIVWSQNALRKLLRRNQTMGVAIQPLFNVALVRKFTGET